MKLYHKFWFFDFSKQIVTVTIATASPAESYMGILIRT